MDISLLLSFEGETLLKPRFQCNNCECHDIQMCCPNCKTADPIVRRKYYLDQRDYGEEYCALCGLVFTSTIPLWSGDYKFRPVYGLRK